MASEEILKLWTEHQHAESKTIIGQEYYHREVAYCPICQLFAKRPDSEHVEHPAGCRCIICSDCRCKAVVDRDERAAKEKHRLARVAELKKEVDARSAEINRKQSELYAMERELMDLMVKPKEG